MASSFMELIKQVSHTGDDTIACTVSKTKPLQLKFQGDTKVVLDKDVLVIPKHVKGLSKGKTVYVMPSKDGAGYVVLGRG
ncbi:MAG: hypothetical protein K6G60_10225 [Lachnospiraceae bacterium]|nr:hypothetical protein [Lachnospiraceae bacterium]